MGFYVRKSLRAGPFRFNLSKSGLGVSAGIPGFRVGSGPRGNYVHVSSHGVYYRATLGKRVRAEPRRSSNGPWSPPPSSDIVLEDTTGGAAMDLQPSGADDLVSQLNQAGQRLAAWPFALGIALLVGFAMPSPFGGLLLLVGLLAAGWLALRDRARRSVVTFYEVQGPQAEWFQALLDVWGLLGAAAGLWRIDAAGRITNTYQYKVNSGASTLVSRIRAAVSLKPSKVLVTNIAVPSLSAGRHYLHFLPDRVLVREGRTFSEVPYSELSAAWEETRFIESVRPPRDGKQVDVTWQYVNVKGGPDRRFKNNRQLPVMLYGRMLLTSSSGLRWILDCSHPQVAQQVADALCAAETPHPISGPPAAERLFGSGDSPG